MTFYTYKDADGNIHVQNAVMGMLGQHHVHTPADFRHWGKPGDDIQEMYALCDCGMKPGESCNGWPKKVGEA
jgi:hypothetical protein